MIDGRGQLARRERRRVRRGRSVDQIIEAIDRLVRFRAAGPRALPGTPPPRAWGRVGRLKVILERGDAKVRHFGLARVGRRRLGCPALRELLRRDPIRHGRRNFEVRHIDRLGRLDAFRQLDGRLRFDRLRDLDRRKLGDRRDLCRLGNLHRRLSFDGHRSLYRLWDFSRFRNVERLRRLERLRSFGGFPDLERARDLVGFLDLADRNLQRPRDLVGFLNFADSDLERPWHFIRLNRNLGGFRHSRLRRLGMRFQRRDEVVRLHRPQRQLGRPLNRTRRCCQQFEGEVGTADADRCRRSAALRRLTRPPALVPRRRWRLTSVAPQPRPALPPAAGAP